MTGRLPGAAVVSRTTDAVLAAYTDDKAGMAVLRAAAAEASLRHGRLKVIHQLIGPEAPEVFGTQEVVDLTRRRIESQILTTVRRIAPGCDITVDVIADSIADHVVQASRTAELVVVGATSTHALAAALVQAVPRELARHAHCPVLLMPAAAADQPIAQVVCGIDRSPASVAALWWAGNEAALRGGTVIAVEVLRDRGEAAASGKSSEPLTTWLRRQAPQLATTVLGSQLVGSPARLLLDISAEDQALLVVGAHQRHDGHWLRSVARSVMSQTLVPVVIVPTDDTL